MAERDRIITGGPPNGLHDRQRGLTSKKKYCFTRLPKCGPSAASVGRTMLEYTPSGEIGNKTKSVYVLVRAAEALTIVLSLATGPQVNPFPWIHPETGPATSDLLSPSCHRDDSHFVPRCSSPDLAGFGLRSHIHC